MGVDQTTVRHADRSPGAAVRVRTVVWLAVGSGGERSARGRRGAVIDRDRERERVRKSGMSYPDGGAGGARPLAGLLAQQA
jgi:hypothetical protein